LRAAGIFAVVAFTCGEGDRLGEATALAQSRDVSEAQVLFVDARCDRFFERNGVQQYYAEASFAGRSARSLARVSAIAHLQDDESAPPGYRDRILHDEIFVREGAAAILCGSSMDGLRFDSVTFVVPRSYKLELDSKSPW
jgi:hypothetical protein